MATIAQLDALVAEAQRQLAANQLPGAEAACHKLLAVMPDHPAGLMILCMVCLRQGRRDEAEALLSRGADLYPAVLGFQATLARVRLEMGKLAEAMHPLECCVLLQPEERTHRVSLVAVYQTRLFATFSEQSKQAMTACLADDALAHSLINKAWLSLLRLDPDSAGVLQLFSSDTAEAFARRVTPALLSDWQGNQFLNAGFDRFLAADPAIERGLTFARRWLFENGTTASGFLPLLCRLSRICFHAEYVFDTVEDWEGLRVDVTTAARAAMLGCYEPLFRRPDAPRMAELSPDPAFQELVRIQISEPLREAAIEPTIPVLSPITDEVSRLVRDQYEQNPYPRWMTVGGSLTDTETGGGAGAGKTILIAGCGTGREAVEAALLFPAARIEAIDLSRASLAYGMRRSRELGIANLSFRQGDILDLSGGADRFDLIMASGVLHHMKDPRAGLRALLEVLRPRGILRLGLYSTIARAAVAQARALIAREGFPSTTAGIRAFRATIFRRGEDDPLRKALTTSYDFYSLSQCRDLLFHVQEHTFTLPQLDAMAHDFDLTVLRVDTKSPAHRAAYHARFPQDAAATNLLNWHAHEQEHPTTFAGLYSLWCCRAAEVHGADMSWLPGHPGASGAA